jgi:hypothetical protein
MKWTCSEAERVTTVGCVAAVSVAQLFTRFVALTDPSPVARSYPGFASVSRRNAGVVRGTIDAVPSCQISARLRIGTQRSRHKRCMYCFRPDSIPNCMRCSLAVIRRCGAAEFLAGHRIQIIVCQPLLRIGLLVHQRDHSGESWRGEGRTATRSNRVNWHWAGS